MRTIANLLLLGSRVYVSLPSKTLAKLFLKNAEAEGFTGSDGKLPTEMDTANIIALNWDWTLSYVGYVGHVEFGMRDDGTGKLKRVNYARYVAGADDYLIITKQDDKDKKNAFQRFVKRLCKL